MEIKYSGSELKKIILNEKNGVPDGLYQTSVEFYNKIIEFLTNNKNKTIDNGLNFIINGNFNISDFKFNESKIEIIVDYSNMYSTKLELDKAFDASTTKIVDKFYLKTLEYSPENNKTTFKFNYDNNYRIQCIHILKFFTQNKSEIIIILNHELKHRYDNIKKPVNNILKVVDYKSFNYRSKLPPIDHFIYAMYYISNYEKNVKNSEFYALLRQSNITKETFTKTLVDSEMYRLLKNLSTLSLDRIKTAIEKYYIKELDDMLLVTKNYNKSMSLDEKIQTALEITYVGISNLKLSYLNMELNSPTNIIINSYLTNENFYNEEKNKLDDMFYLNYYNKKLKEINTEATKCLKKLSKLYNMVQEQRKITFETITLKPVENCFLI